MSTYTLISSNVLSASAASVTFSSIPSTYTDLVLRVSARSDNASIFDGLWITVNSDSTSNYSYTYLYGSGSAATSSRGTSTTFDYAIMSASAATATASTFGNAEIYFPSYTSTSSRPISAFGVGENNATAAYMGISAGLYRGASAISTIAMVTATGGNFVSGSSFYLYGISKN